MPTEFKTTRRVQFAETDMAGVLHFSNYYRYMEEIEHAFWRSLGLSVMTNHPDSGVNEIISWPRVATSCQYFSPARFEDELELVFTVTEISNRSFTFEVDFRLDGRGIARGRTTAVCCQTEGGGRFQSISIPDSIRARLSALLVSSS